MNENDQIFSILRNDTVFGILDITDKEVVMLSSFLQNNTKNVVFLDSEGWISVGELEDNMLNGRYLLFDKERRIKKVLWFHRNNRNYYEYSVKNNLRHSLLYNFEHVDTASLISPKIEFFRNSVNSDVLSMVFYSNSYPLEFITISLNGKLQNYDSNNIMGSVYLETPMPKSGTTLNFNFIFKCFDGEILKRTNCEILVDYNMFNSLQNNSIIHYCDI